MMMTLTQEPLFDHALEDRGRDVIKYVTHPRPRAAYQTYNTFVFQQMLVVNHGFGKKISPNHTVALASLRYRWPDVFDEIVKNQNFFYYLHALATNRHNGICDSADLNELRSVGPPSCARNSKLFEYKKYPDIVAVLEGFGPVHEFYLSSLFELLTLENDPKGNKVLNNKIQGWDALISGDPAKVKLVSDLRDERIKEYRNLMLNLLTGLNERINKSREEKRMALINEAEAIIFALGRMTIPESPAYEVGILEALLSDHPHLPEILQSRIVYALGRFAKVDQTAREVLARNLGNEQLPLNIRTLIARNVGYIEWDRKEQAQKIWEVYSPEWPLSTRRNLVGNWNGIVVGIKPEYITDEILRTMERNPWDSSLGTRLINICLAGDGDMPERAFNLLLSFGKSSENKIQSPEDKTQIMLWLAELLPQSEKFREECWNQLGELQRDVPWQEEIWERLSVWAVEHDDNSIVEMLRKTEMRKACDLLKSLLDEKQVPHWRNLTKEVLLELDDSCSEE